MELSVPVNMSPSEAVSALSELHSQLQTTLAEVTARHDEVYAQRTKATYAMLRESVETGSHGAGATSLLALIATCHDLRDDWDRTVTEALEPILSGTRGVVRALAERFGVAVPLLQAPSPDGDVSMDVDAGVPGGAKRRRLDPEGGADAGATQRGVLAVLRDPARTFGRTLSADEHRLLSTVVAQSALLPDLAAMHDVYHPNVCLYATDRDRRWTDRTTVHLGFYVSTMLHEFAVLRGSMRRFTFGHLLCRMGFGAPDVNFYATYLDDTFFRRVYCDTRSTFLAEGYSPKIRLYRGSGWLRLLDLFLAGPRRDVPWYRLTRAGAIAEELLQELDVTDPHQLVPSTLLGALHRKYGQGLSPYDAWPDMERLAALEGEFVRDVRQLAQGRLGVILDELPTVVRAWPVCLRQVAVEHVRHLLKSLAILPRCPQVAGGAPDVAAWLWSVADRTEDRPVWGDSPALLRRKLEGHMVVPAGPVSAFEAAATELCEAEIQRAAERRYGPATPADEQKLQGHLDRLDRLIRAAQGHGPEQWTTGERRIHGYRPSEVFAAIQSEASYLLPDEYEQTVAARLQTVLDDPIMHHYGGENVCGDSQLRPRNVYP
jgi:hypothetical protein